ncbi:MAG: crosslink repair DNA glycosylase YcaQ family protein [Tahibacter sp.]
MQPPLESSAVIGPGQARALHLAAQGLLTRPRGRASRTSLLAAISRMQVLQIDTIHVVARSPYLVLHARLGHYPPIWLDDALAAGKLFECWSHEACFAGMADYPLHRDFRGARAHWAMRNAQRYAASHATELSQLLERIALHGPVKTSDFERADAVAGNAGGWWGWKQEKRWLEALFALGELMIARRENFHRVYDLRERVLQNSQCTDVALLEARDATQVRREFILRSVKALGITQARWIADYFRLGRQIRDAELTSLVETGQIRRVAVRGWENPAYVHCDHESLLQRAIAGGLRATHSALLSPFDPVVWDRERALSMFGFDYRLECYTPGPKRQFGYFVLPILVRGRLVGRLDAKAHRREGRFEVKALHLQEDVESDGRMIADIAAAIVDCARWHGTESISIVVATPKSLRGPIQKAVDACSASPAKGTMSE